MPHPPSPDAPELVRSLSRPEAHPELVASVEMVETHISWVFLAGSRVCKCKKPVRFPFLDYSTPELRHRACADEVRLNRRLAPDVYLGVEPITRREDGSLRVGGDGPVVDWCVVMKRLPADRMLDRLIEQKRATTADMERVLDVLTPFYAAADRSAEIDEEATAAHVALNARENFTTLDAIDHGLPRPVLQRVRSAQCQFLQLSADLFARRMEAGRICEGHGDLRPEHVCLLDPPVVFDCVEFSLPLRSADVLSELAFLAMEYDFLGAPELATALLTGYRRRSGDDAPDSLAAFYKSYRACIRAKVELLRAGQQSEEGAVRPRQRGRCYLQLASGYTSEFHRPLLLVVLGAAGTGKSTIAAALADALGAEWLRTDAIRHEPGAPREDGLYTETMNQWTYDTLLARAGVLLGEAVSVVLDGTFRRAVDRERAVRLAQQYGAGVHFILCQCPPELARQRIADRLARGDGVSDARPELHELHRQELEAVAEWTGADVVVLDTTEPVAVLLPRILDRLRRLVPRT